MAGDQTGPYFLQTPAHSLKLKEQIFVQRPNLAREVCFGKLQQLYVIYVVFIFFFTPLRKGGKFIQIAKPNIDN